MAGLPSRSPSCSLIRVYSCPFVVKIRGCPTNRIRFPIGSRQPLCGFSLSSRRRCTIERTAFEGSAITTPHLLIVRRYFELGHSDFIIVLLHSRPPVPPQPRNEGVFVFKSPVVALASAAVTINWWQPWRRVDTNSLEPAKALVTLDDVEKSGQPSQKG